MIQTVAVAGYRSLVDLVLPLGRLTVVTGANGTGKSSLYRALRLLAAGASGDAIGAIAEEGGLDSALWAGPETPGGAGAQGTVRRGPISLRLGVATDHLGYLVDYGIPQTDKLSVFARDAEIKREQIFAGAVARPATTLVDRTRAAVRVRRDGWVDAEQRLAPFESILTDLGDGDAAPETLSVRRMLRAWRFYDHFRTDRDAPARHPGSAHARRPSPTEARTSPPSGRRFRMPDMAMPSHARWLGRFPADTSRSRHPVASFAC
tara:strand:- start:2273 stop:3061 length:789 start_codon:yes stop_codon:yes gene_type:complete